MTTEGAGTVFEFTVAGPLGPLFRSAFAGERIAALDSCTVIRVRVPADRDLDLVDLLGYFDAAGLRVRDLFRVCRPDEGSDERPTRARRRGPQRRARALGRGRRGGRWSPPRERTALDSLTPDDATTGLCYYE